MVKFHGLNILIVWFWNLFFLLIIFSKNVNGVNICKSKDYQDTTLKLLNEKTIAKSLVDYSS